MACAVTIPTGAVGATTLSQPITGIYPSVSPLAKDLPQTVGMRRTVGLVGAWTAATLVAVVVAAAAVGSVRTEVTDAPTALGDPSIVFVAAPEIPDPVAQSTSTIFMPPEVTEVDDPVVVAATTSTTVAPLATSTDSTTSTTKAPPVATPSTTTSTVNAGAPKTYDTEAGSVRIVVAGSSVTFAGATPLPGWTVELENSGPEEVKVHFEQNDDEEHEIEFKAKIDDGELKVSISGGEDD